MKESIEKRIAKIKECEDPSELKKYVCPFYEKGGHPDCALCRKTDADVEECRDYYLERIGSHPMDVWCDEFDVTIAESRELVDLDTVIGIGMSCDNCYMADKCPMFKRGFTCGIKWDNNRPQNPAEFMDFLINTQYERVRRAAVIEKVDGGVPDANLSSEMDRLNGFIATKVDMGRERFSLNVEATGGAAAPAGGGILAKLFGGGSGSDAKALPESKHETIELPALDAEYEEIPAKKKRR